MPGRYLITGGAGLVGAALTRALLARGDHVSVLDSGVACGFESLAGTAARVVQGDIRDAIAVDQALDGVTAIVHLAARTSVPDSIADPAADFDVNVGGSLAVLEAARSRGIRRLIFASSNAVVGGHPPPTHEGLTPCPVSPYGAAKAAVEAYLVGYDAAYGIDGVSLRFGNAYGPWSLHKTNVVASFIKAYLAGGPLVIRGDGHQTRDFVHVADVAAAVVAALDAPADDVRGEVFQIATGVETSLRDLAELVFDAGGGRTEIRYEPPSPGDVPRNVSDIAKARRTLGYVPSVEIREGIASTLEWFRDHQRGVPHA